ncbi:hypothetical protein DSO57_1016511 [Entomophthora muscae]|uniref:Uncharacterized protein n=1 Tax=Entomophthora muscae TaxID=34485 RepID=A0ACC2UPL9_9FUNG|nr:hypothetical protein DSO57_1016511 [Entomophthora muscae]
MKVTKWVMPNCQSQKTSCNQQSLVTNPIVSILVLVPTLALVPGLEAQVDFCIWLGVLGRLVRVTCVSCGELFQGSALLFQHSWLKVGFSVERYDGRSVGRLSGVQTLYSTSSFWDAAPLLLLVGLAWSKPIVVQDLVLFLLLNPCTGTAVGPTFLGCSLLLPVLITQNLSPTSCLSFGGTNMSCRRFSSLVSWHWLKELEVQNWDLNYAQMCVVNKFKEDLPSRSVHLGAAHKKGS